MHLWLGRLLLFFALINIGLGIQLYGDGAAVQAVWYIFVIAVVAAYGFFYWRIHLQKRKRTNDAFDPSPFEDPTEEGTTKPYEPLRQQSHVVTMNDNDLGTYRSEYYDPDDSGVNEYGARVQGGGVPTITAVNRPTTAVPSTSAGRRYDTPTVAGPYGSTEPLRTGGQSDAQVDPFADPYRPRTGRSQAPYPTSMVSTQESMPSTSAPPYNTPSYDRHFV